MRTMDFIASVGPIVTRRDHPTQRSAIDWAVRTHQLRAVLPGVLLVPEIADDLHWRMAAVAAWNPDAVIVGEAAAQAGFWPDLRVTEIEVAVRSRARAPGYRFVERALPVEPIDDSRPVRLAVPALAALDCIDTRDTDAIDHALRSRRITLPDLWAALEATPDRSGNRQKRRALIHSRTKPWSAAERLAHRILLAAKIGGWTANCQVDVDRQRYYIDIASPVGGSRSRSTDASTRTTRRSSRTTDCARTHWCATVGGFFASPGRCW